jgi:hypothetical protein
MRDWSWWIQLKVENAREGTTANHIVGFDVLNNGTHSLTNPCIMDGPFRRKGRYSNLHEGSFLAANGMKIAAAVVYIT